MQGQASWANMTSLEDKLTALVSHLTKKVNKGMELTYLSINVESYLSRTKKWDQIHIPDK
jgi:hypothetical protein